jgi:hypothetical protein
MHRLQVVYFLPKFAGNEGAVVIILSIFYLMTADVGDRFPCEVGFGRADTLSGDGGDDILLGGNGPDILLGGDGKDDLLGVLVMMYSLAVREEIYFSWVEELSLTHCEQSRVKIRLLTLLAERID